MPKKSDEEFFKESLDFWFEYGKELCKICPDCTNEYNEHSLFKLIGFTYWVGYFLPIIHRNFRIKYHYRICYLDVMAGSGVTSTKRAGDYFCGSCPGVLLSPKAKKFPFDLVIAIEKDKEKAKALENRLKSLNLHSEIMVIDQDINDCIDEIISKIKEEKSKSYTIIDPEGYEGLYWSTIESFLKLNGDMMINWFEHDILRMQRAALSDATNEKVKESQINRLNEMFGDDRWKKAVSSLELTELFTDRLIKQNKDSIVEIVKIPRAAGDFKLILLTSKNVQKQAKDWAKRVASRINSLHGKDISKLLDVKAGRISSLEKFGL